jgi:hypothetical protein
MGTRHFIGGLLIIVAVTALISCKKNDMPRPCLRPPYSFNITAVVKPEKEVYSLGDTVYVESVFPTTLRDIASGGLIDYRNTVNVGGGQISLGELDSISKTIKDSSDIWAISALQGSLTTVNNLYENRSIKTVYYVENSNTYNFQAQIILNKVGIFRIAITNMSSIGIRNRDCSNASFQMQLDNPNRNLFLLENALGIEADPQLDKGIFCFRVQ